MSELGSADCPLRVAVVGSGPSGFYAAAALLKSDLDVHVHMFERLPVPFGLVRYGVAPDHGKIRNVVKVYDKTAADERFSFWGNVEVGRDLGVDELAAHYDAVIYGIGALEDRRLGIEGEDLPRSHTATAFCSWYNGHPDFLDTRFELGHEVAVVIGQGNVAMDVCRTLVMPVQDLLPTDMAVHATDALADSRVRAVHCIGRRGPVQAAFTPKEIAELTELQGCRLVVRPEDLELSQTDLAELALPDRSAAQRNIDVLRKAADQSHADAPKQIILHFNKSPLAIHPAADGGVGQVVLEHNQLAGEPGAQKARGTGETETLDCDLVFRSIGYRGVGLPGLPFDEKRAVIPNEGGRVDLGVYAVGWIKRGPSGLIGTNKKDSEQTVELLMKDVPRLEPATQRDDKPLQELLAGRNVRVVSYADWRKIDRAEIDRGKATGKARGNFTRVEQMLAVLEG